MSFKVDIKVKAEPFEGLEIYKQRMDTFMVLAGASLNELLTHESAQRPDGKGNPDGAVDTGNLSNSFFIIEQDDERVRVGTNVEYALGLAKGLPDPSASLEFIREWRERKNVPRRAKQVYDKITTEGPIANPFHERAMDDFLLRVDEMLEEAWK